MKSYETEESGNVYIVQKYDNGSTIKVLKSAMGAPDPQRDPVTLDQVYEQNLDIMDGLATLYEMQAGGAE
jgi:hypothetical protein